MIFFDDSLTAVQQLLSKETGGNFGRKLTTLCAVGALQQNPVFGSTLCAVTAVSDPAPFIPGAYRLGKEIGGRGLEIINILHGDSVKTMGGIYLSILLC